MKLANGGLKFFKVTFGCMTPQSIFPLPQSFIYLSCLTKAQIGEVISQIN